MAAPAHRRPSGRIKLDFRRAESRRDYSGWFCSEAFEFVRNCGIHEIACHGFRHVPHGGKDIGEVDADYELRSATELANAKGISLKTFVFPRDRGGYLYKLASEGYIGFRNARPNRDRRGRLGNLIQETNLHEKSQSSEPRQCSVISIGGDFLNWRHGLRRPVPEFATLIRWRSILEDAAANNRVALLFLHPHNLMDGYGMAELFGGVLRIAAELRDSKGLTILTQQEYCGLRRL